MVTAKETFSKREILINVIQKEFKTGVRETKRLIDRIEESKHIFDILTEREKAIINYIWNSYTSDLWDYISKLMDIEKTSRNRIISVITRLRQGYEYAEYSPNMYLTPIVNKNAHNYTIGRIYRVCGYDCVAVDDTGWKGNNLPELYHQIRPANVEEIAKFIINKYRKDIERVFIEEDLTQDPVGNMENFLEKLIKENK
jgi:hypothetical protein